MKKFLIYIVLLLTSIIHFACSNEETTPSVVVNSPINGGTGIFELNLLPRVRGQEFEAGLRYENSEGKDFVVEDWKFYMSEVKIISSANDTLSLADVLLWSMSGESVREVQHGDGIFVQFEVPAGDYKGLLFSIGIPEDLNHAATDTLATDSPLHPSQNMYWNRSAGYQFVKILGEIDTSTSPNSSQFAAFEYILGLDDLFRSLAWTEVDHAFSVIAEEETQFTLEVDLLSHFFNEADTISMSEHLQITAIPPGSSSFELSKQMMNNFTQTGFAKIPF